VKKIRITVNKGSKGKKFPVFNSPESLYVWMYDEELREASKLDPSLGVMINLRPGEVMEVEWMGCEYVHEESFQFRVDQVRLAKTMQVKSISKTRLVGVYGGWTSEDVLTFKSCKDEDVKITKLTPKSKHKFDIHELFESRSMNEDQEKEETDPAKLH
jgi:hypothetical protein